MHCFTCVTVRVSKPGKHTLRQPTARGALFTAVRVLRFRSNTKYCTAANIVPDLRPEQLASSDPTHKRKRYNVCSSYGTSCIASVFCSVVSHIKPCMQGHRRSITCDAAYQYLASIFRCKTMNDSDMSVPDVLMLSTGIQKLCGARSKHIWCSQQKQHLQRAGTGPTTKDASVRCSSLSSSAAVCTYSL